MHSGVPGRGVEPARADARRIASKLADFAKVVLSHLRWERLVLFGAGDHQRQIDRLQLEIERLEVLAQRPIWVEKEKLVAERFASVLERVALAQAELEPVSNPEIVPPVWRYDRMWKLRNRSLPYSCSDEEGLLMYSLITANHLRRGFEIATAFGYSSTYLGMALKDVGGELISLDCYIEESMESDRYNQDDLAASVVSVRRRVDRGEPPLGLATASRLADLLDITSTVRFEVGLSPRDVAAAVGGRALDFAFIDGGHHGEQPTEDFLAVAPFLGERCAVFFHDNHPGNGCIERAVAAAERTLGSSSKVLATRNYLTLVGRGLEPGSVDDLDDLVARQGLRSRRPA